MAESTGDATADTLSRELKKILTEIFYDGGGSKDSSETEGCFGVLKSIDDAVTRILTCLREVESKKKPESDCPSSPMAEVPKEFKCTLSHAIMWEPVVIASGETYEKRYITQWLMYERTCPKTKQVLSNLFWTPNHLIDELITNWCEVNNYYRPRISDETVIGLFSHDIDSLLQRISSPYSVEDQIEAANELRRQTKKFANVRACFISEIHDSLTRLLSPLSSLCEAANWNPELQRNIITTLFNISVLKDNQRVIANHPLVIPLLTMCLNQGTVKTQRNSAAALMSLTATDYNKVIIGNSNTLKALIYLIREGDWISSIEAAYAVLHLCTMPKNWEKAVSNGLIPVLTNKIKAGNKVDHLLDVLTSMSTQDRAIAHMEDLGFIDDLFSILRKPSSSMNELNALTIVYNMCMDHEDRNREMTRLKVVDEEENKYGTFTKLVKQGSERVVEKAEVILRGLKRHGAGKKPQRE